MRHLLERLRLRWHTRHDPKASILADYEVLVRLARRCAYDFSHASDYVKLPDFLKDAGFDYPARARMWIGLFAKGNPGKDYRNRITTQAESATDAVRQLMKVMDEAGHGELVPAHIRREFDDIPF